ncbi:hypothetical protein BC827DRAFT_1272425 [Russula dissimulans]|nr:hypothetical protein BC827DRAFT_1272425 [Russula dissimulans]
MVDHHTLTIQYLPNELLLHIFSFHRLLSGEHNRPPPAARRWHRLAHVCQRWRNLIFASLHHLEARLIIPRKSPETPLDSWPALPLSVWYEGYAHASKKQIADIVPAFEHSERIREIRLSMKMRRSFWTPFRNKSSPELEHLALLGIDDCFCPIALPHEFLGGPTCPRRLRNIFLDSIYLPALPQLLSSNRDLVSLHLGSYALPHRLVSPVELSTALSATTQLEYLYICCIGFSPEDHSELTSVNSSPRNPVVLPALTYFEFVDSIYYLENLVSRIHAPHLLKLVVYPDRPILDVPQLSQFISRTERLSSSPSRTSITFGYMDFTIKHHFGRLPSPQGASFVLFTSHYMSD